MVVLVSSVKLLVKDDLLSTKRLYKTIFEKVDDREDIIHKLERGFSCLHAQLPDSPTCYFTLQTSTELLRAITEFLDSDKMKIYYISPKVENHVRQEEHIPMLEAKNLHRVPTKVSSCLK